MRKYGLKLPFPATLLPFYPLVDRHPVPQQIAFAALAPVRSCLCRAPGAHHGPGAEILPNLSPPQVFLVLKWFCDGEFTPDIPALRAFQSFQLAGHSFRIEGLGVAALAGLMWFRIALVGRAYSLPSGEEWLHVLPPPPTRFSERAGSFVWRILA